MRCAGAFARSETHMPVRKRTPEVRKEERLLVLID